MRDQEGIYNSLNEIHKLQRNRELDVKDIKDVRILLEKSDRTGKLKW